MDEHSSGDSTALISHLTERALGHAGVVDAEHPRRLYQRTAGWVAERLPLLAHLTARYDVGDQASAQPPPLLLGQPMSATAYAAPQFAQTASPGGSISRKADDSLSRSHSPDSSSPSTAKYRISRHPSYMALMANRAAPSADSLSNGADIQSGDAAIASEPETSVATARDKPMPAVELPRFAEYRESSEPHIITARSILDKEAESATEVVSSDSGGSSTESPRRAARETPPPPNESKSIVSAPRSDALASGTSRTIVQRQQAPAEFIYLKRYAIGGRQEKTGAPPGVPERAATRAANIDPEVVTSGAHGEAPRRADSQMSASTSTALDRQAEKVVAVEESLASSPIHLHLAAPSRGAPAEVGPIAASSEPDAPGPAWSRGSAASPELIERQVDRADEPLVLRETRSGADNGQNETIPDASAAQPLPISAKGPSGGRVNFIGQTVASRSGGEAAQPSIAAPHNSGVGVIARPKAGARGVSLTLSRQTSQSARPPSLPLVISQAATAAQPGRDVTSDTEPVVAAEMRLASGHVSPPDIVWRKSATAQGDASIPLTQKTAGGLVGRQVDGSSAASPLPVAQSPPSVASSVSHSNGENGNDGGISIENLIRVLHKRLAIERERRGIAR